MTSPVRLGRLRGAGGPDVHVTPVAVALVVMAGAFAGLGAGRAGLQPLTQVAVGVTVALVVAASLALHVAGHLLVARRLGLPVTRLEVSAAGGIAWLAPAGAPTPAQVATVAAGGPAATAALALLAGVVSLVMAGAAVHEGALWVLRANAFVLAVNLVPVGRLDARAALALAVRP